MKLVDVHGKDPVVIPSGGTIVEAAELMDQKAVGSVMVMDGERLVGIATDRDLVVRAVARRVPIDARIDSVMTTNVVTIDGEADVRDACRLFAEHPIRRLPVMSGDTVVGLIIVDDLTLILVNDLADATRPMVAEALFGHPEPGLPVRV